MCKVLMLDDFVVVRGCYINDVEKALRLHNEGRIDNPIEIELKVIKGGIYALGSKKDLFDFIYALTLEFNKLEII